MAVLQLPDGPVSLKAVQALLDQIGQPVVVYGRGKLSVVTFNQALSDLYRYKPPDLKGRSILELRPPSEAERTIQVVKQIVRPGDIGTFIYRTKDGAEFPGSVYAAPIAPGLIMSLVTDLRDAAPDTPQSEPERLVLGPDLTPREREVTRHLALGLTSREIAEALGITPRTVEAHVDNILAKLGARNRAHAIALALGNDLLFGNHRN